MKNLIRLLLLLFVVQAAVVVVHYWPQTRDAGLGGNGAMLPFDPARIDEIHIGDEYDNEVVMIQAASAYWLLPDMDKLPANTAAIRQLLAALVSSRQQQAIATSIAARQRFQVAAYHYQRRISLIAEGELLATLYLGTAPGFRQVHARNDAQDAIYTIAYNNYDAPARASSWLDPKLLRINQPSRIANNDFDIRRHPQDRWLTATGDAASPAVLQRLLSALAELAVAGLADEDMQRSLSEAAAPSLSLRVSNADTTVLLEFFALDKGYYVHDSRYSLFFKLPAASYRRFTQLRLERLAGPKTQDPISSAVGQENPPPQGGH